MTSTAPEGHGRRLARDCKEAEAEIACLRAALADRGAALDQARRDGAALDEIRALHRDVGGICAQCHVHGHPGAPWPCPTARALDKIA